MMMLVILLSCGLVFLVLLWTVYWQPRPFIRLLSSWRPECTWWSPHGWRVLTVDDVPGPCTEEILDILRQGKNRATLFVIGGWVNGSNRHLLLRALREGHHLANHGWEDRRAGTQPHGQLIEDIRRTEEVIDGLYQEAGVESPEIKYYRPGCGLYGPRLARLSEELPGYRLVLGSLYPHDPQIPLPWLNWWHVAGRWKERDILILHDRRWTPQLLRWLTHRYRWTSLAD